jgi:hypothetical protein
VDNATQRDAQFDDLAVGNLHRCRDRNQSEGIGESRSFR